MRIHNHQGHVPLSASRRMSRIRKASHRTKKAVVFNKYQLMKLNKELQNGTETI